MKKGHLAAKVAKIVSTKKEAKYVSNLLIIKVVTPVGFKPTTAGAEIL